MRIGTRQSPLALQQAYIVKALLIERCGIPQDVFEIVSLSTKGDRLTGPLIEFGGKGLFTKEIDLALLNHEVDIAVHSMKDVATRLPEGIVIPAILEREDPRDVWVSAHYPRFADLPQGAQVGTCSLRRAAQLKYLRPDLQIVNLRGNVGSRYEKIQAGVVDGTLLALAGIKRLGAEHMIGEILSTEMILPAVAQGAIGIACRADDQERIEQLKKLNHLETFICVQAERAFLQEMDGSCRSPIAAHAIYHEKQVQLTGLWGNIDGSKLIRQSDESSVGQSMQSAKELARNIQKMLA